MQQLTPPPPSNADTSKFVEDIFAFLDTLKRRWWFVVVAALVCVSLAGAYLSRLKPVYRASARLLILHQGGQLLKVANNGDPFPMAGGGDDSLSTHVAIIRSPLILKRAVAASGLKGLINDVSVEIPDETAKILEVSYQSQSGDEAVRVVEAVIASYGQFLRENYHKNTSEVISLISRAREDLGQELKGLERDYLEFRQKNPAYTADEKGRSFYTRRIDLWDQAANQAMIRALQLRAQLELGRKLAGEGAEATAVATVISQLGGDMKVGPALPEGAAGLSLEGLRDELTTVEIQRLTAERQLVSLRDRRGVERPVSETEILRAFYAEPATVALEEQLKNARAKYNALKQSVRNTADPSVLAVLGRVRDLERRLAELWRRRQPALMSQGMQPAADDDETRKAETDLIALQAKETTLRERWDRLKAEQLRQLHQQEDQLTKLHGPKHPKVLQLREQLARIEGAAEAKNRPGEGRVASLLESIGQSLEAIEAIRAEYQRRLDEDLSKAKKSEIDLLTEANLRSNLDRQRDLFNSVVGQLKQAQLVGDFGSVTAQTLSPPAASSARPQMALILAFAVLAGCVLGTGAAFVADQLDARLRSPAEMRRVLDVSVIGQIPRLGQGQIDTTGRVGLISHASPQSLLAESYRSVRTNLQFVREDSQVILVTSPNPGDGKTTTASNLAISLAQAGRRVLLIDADLRKPFQHDLYDLFRHHGLVHVLKGLLPLGRVVQQTPVDGLDLLAAGPEVHNPAELLASPRLTELLNEARRTYDVIVLDSSPLLAVTDPSILAAAADGILLVARIAELRRSDAERTAELLKILKTPVLGTVINGVKPDLKSYGYKLYMASCACQPVEGEGSADGAPAVV